jgi:chromosome segregation ATPase
MPRPTPSDRPAASSEEDLKFLKELMFEYVSFMDMDIGRANVAKHKDELERLSAKLEQALTLPSLNLSADFKATLKVIHSEVLTMLAKNAELKVKRTQYLRAVAEKESLCLEINKAKDELQEISSEVMIEDSLMVNLAAQMRELQAKMDDCRARMAAKKRNASQGIERTKSLVEQYKKLEVDDDDVAAELNITSSRQNEDWEKLRERIRSLWGSL